MNTTNKPIKVILIEDSPDDAELIIRILKNKMLEDVIHFNNGEEAISYFDTRMKAGTGKPEAGELVMLDIKMPKVDGFSVLKRIKQEDSSSSIPVLVITSSNHSSDIEKAYALGANSFIVKPVDYDAFCSTIESVIHYWLVINQPL